MGTILSLLLVQLVSKSKLGVIMMEKRKCIICKRGLNKKTVYGGLVGLLCRLFGLANDWKKYSTCQECRDMASFGWSTDEIIKARSR